MGQSCCLLGNLYGACMQCYKRATCLANNISSSVVLLSAARSIQTSAASWDRECSAVAQGMFAIWLKPTLFGVCIRVQGR